MKKSCLNCLNASVTEEQGATFCLCDFDTDCIYIYDPEKKAEKCQGYECSESARKQDVHGQAVNGTHLADLAV